MTEKERIIQILMRAGFGAEGAAIAAEALLAENFHQQNKTADEPPGKWLKATPASQEYCSRCGLTPKMIFGILPDYCPHCGNRKSGEVKKLWLV